jgi:hypothetical protein
MATRLATAGFMVVLGVDAADALDCARVKSMHAAGTKPSEIARELGLTTPDVQSCLANQEAQQPVRPRPANALPLGPTVPNPQNPTRREPGQ